MSRRENKELANTNLKNMDKTMQKLRTANDYTEERGIYKDLISKNEK